MESASWHPTPIRWDNSVSGFLLFRQRRGGISAHGFDVLHQRVEVAGRDLLLAETRHRAEAVPDLKFHQEFGQGLVHDRRSEAALPVRVTLMTVLKKYLFALRHLGIAGVD